MKIGYFPGCSLHSTGRELDESLKALAGPLELQLSEVDDWSCCGASSAHSANHELGVALGARNLSLAKAQGHDRVMAPCAACFNRLAMARHEVDASAALRGQMEKLLGRKLDGGVEVMNVVALLREVEPLIRKNVQRALSGLKVACYYGCLLVRPAEVAGKDDPEAPTSMEQVVSALGATPVTWHRRLDCCGGSFSLSRVGSVVRLGRAIVEDARAAGAQVIAVACPMCHSNLDMRQKAMAARGAAGMPIVYITQLAGLALGLAPGPLGLSRHFVSTAPLLAWLAGASKALPAASATPAKPAPKPAAKPPAASASTPAGGN
jgi:heterodisulfide reductase subunit B